MKKTVRTFASLAWTVGDVRSVSGRAKKMTIKQAEEFLERNETRLRDRMTEVGFEVIGHLLDEEG